MEKARPSSNLLIFNLSEDTTLGSNRDCSANLLVSYDIVILPLVVIQASAWFIVVRITGVDLRDRYEICLPKILN